jgi:hypothetical protein
MRSFRVSESLKSGGKEAGRKGSVRPGKAELTSFEPEPDYFLSNHPPAKPGAFGREPLKAALQGR